MVIGPPVSPVPLLMLVIVPPELGDELVIVTVPPKATVPPPDNPGPACTVTELLASMAFVTPAEGMLIVPLVVIGPPVRPAPVLTLVTVPPSALGKVWPGAKLMSPLLAIESPVSVGKFPFDPNSRFNEPEGLEELFPVGSACQRKSCGIADELSLLNEDACKSNGLELNPCVVVAMPVPGNRAPAAESVLVNVAVVPLSPPVRAPPESCKYRVSVKSVSRPSVPLVVIGPPVSPVPVLMLVIVPPELGEALVIVTVPPKATVPPPDNPAPACTVTNGLASRSLVTPAGGMLIVPLAVIGPPVSPAPVLTPVTVPLLVPGKVWPEAKLIRPLFAMESPVSVGEFPFDPNSRFNEPEGLEELFPVGSACQRKF